MASSLSHLNVGQSSVADRLLPKTLPVTDTETPADVTPVDRSTKKINIVSFNLHGFNQSIHNVRDMMFCGNYDVFILQEHWLTPFNVRQFNDSFSEFTCFGSSAMCSDVESGVLHGRPHNGIMTLVSNNCTQFISSDDRFVIFTVGNLMIVKFICNVLTFE